MNKIIIIFLAIFMAFVFSNIVYSFEIPYPLETELVEERTEGEQIIVQNYSSLLNQSNILQFYQNSLDRQGWEEIEGFALEGIDSIPEARIYGFSRGEEALILEFSPFSLGDMVFYTIKAGPMAKIFASGGFGEQIEDEIIQSGEDVDSINGIPIYPDAIKIFQRKTGLGLKTGYKTNDSIEQVKEFYQEKFLEFGWKLSHTRNVKEEGFCDHGISDKCKQGSLEGVEVEGIALEFQRGIKKCSVAILNFVDASYPVVDIEAFSMQKKTIIAMSYDEKK